MSKQDIIDDALEEIKTIGVAITQFPVLREPLDEVLNAYIQPAAKLDRTAGELTIDVNAKIRELEVLTNEITTQIGCGTSLQNPNTGLFEAVGTNVSYDVLTAYRNDSETPGYAGVNPFSGTQNGQTTPITTGTNPTTIIENRLGIGVTTIIHTTGQFLAQESDAVDHDVPANPCEITSGSAYNSAYPGHVGTLYSARRATLLNEIAAARVTRNEQSNLDAPVNVLKKEMQFKYTQRHSYYYGEDQANKRKQKLNDIITLTNDVDLESYFT